MKTICIDCRFWGVGDTGIGRYVQNLVTNLPVDPNIQVVLLIRPQHEADPILAKFVTYQIPSHPYSTFAGQLQLTWALLKIRPDVLHIPHYIFPLLWPGKLILTIHDLIMHMSTGKQVTTTSTGLYWFKHYLYRFAVWYGVHRANHIIVPAQFWKDELIKRFYLNPSKVSVTYEAVEPVYFQSKTLPTEPFVIYTGNLYPHKNVPVLIQAVESVPNLTLYIVSARSVFWDRLPKLPQVKLLGRLTDTEIIDYYQRATAFVTPSLLEGFGLPGLEAMAAGCPVIAANASCLPEIYGDAALYFDPNSVSDLITQISKLQSNTVLRKRLISAGHNQAKKYSWVTMSEQTWQIYHNVLH